RAGEMASRRLRGMAATVLSWGDPPQFLRGGDRVSLLAPGSTLAPAFPPVGAVACSGTARRSQWRDRAGFTPAALFRRRRGPASSQMCYCASGTAWAHGREREERIGAGGFHGRPREIR